MSVGKDLTDKLQLDAGYKYDKTDYEAPELYSWSQNLASLEAAHAMTDKSSVTLTGKIGSQESKGNTENADFREVLLGVKTRLSRKVDAKAGVGRFSHDSGSASISKVGYDASLVWQATDKVLLSAIANNTVEPATIYRNNYVIVSKGAASGVWAIDQTYSVTLTGMYIQNDYDQDVVVNKVATKLKDHIASGAIRFTYSAPAKFLKVFVEGKKESKDSTDKADNYDQTMATIGAMLTY